MRRKSRKNVRWNIRNWIFFFIKPLSIIIIIIITIVIIIIDHRSLSSSVVLSVPRFAWRANRRVSFPPAATEYQRKEHLLAGKVRYTTEAHLFLALPLVLCISWSLLVHFSAGLQLKQFCTSYQIHPREPYFLSADNAPPTIKITFPCI